MFVLDFIQLWLMYRTIMLNSIDEQMESDIIHAVCAMKGYVYINRTCSIRVVTLTI